MSFAVLDLSGAGLCAGIPQHQAPKQGFWSWSLCGRSCACRCRDGDGHGLSQPVAVVNYIARYSAPLEAPRFLCVYLDERKDLPVPYLDLSVRLHIFSVWGKRLRDAAVDCLERKRVALDTFCGQWRKGDAS